MSILELLVLSTALSMDAFAVSVCEGLRMTKTDIRRTVTVGSFFGIAQALMPVLGYFLGARFHESLTEWDHWIAFVLLGFIGGKMIVESVRGGEKECVERTNTAELLILSVATSIDAMVVGLTFAFLGMEILFPALLIGIVTCILCVLGVFLGKLFGEKIRSYAEIVGGSMLILIGLKILLEHTGIL